MRGSIAVMLAAVVVATACGSSAVSGDVTISGTEFAFKPNALRWKVGQQVRITLTNDGQKDHEWVVGKDPMAMTGMARTFATQFLADVDVRFERDGKPVEPKMVWMTEMGANERAIALPVGVRPTTVIFTVPNKPGEWEMACFEDDGAHYDDGMKGKVTVEP